MTTEDHLARVTDLARKLGHVLEVGGMGSIVPAGHGVLVFVFYTSEFGAQYTANVGAGIPGGEARAVEMIRAWLAERDTNSLGRKV